MNLHIQKKKSKPAAAPPLLGAHFSIAKGHHNALLEAAAYHCNALQLFTKNANTWKERTLSADEIGRFEAARATTGIQKNSILVVYYTLMLQKSRMPQIQGVQGRSCSKLPRTLGNDGDAVLSAFLEGKKHGKFFLTTWISPYVDSMKWHP